MFQQKPFLYEATHLKSICIIFHFWHFIQSIKHWVSFFPIQKITISNRSRKGLGVSLRKTTKIVWRDTCVKIQTLFITLIYLLSWIFYISTWLTISIHMKILYLYDKCKPTLYVYRILYQEYNDHLMGYIKIQVFFSAMSVKKFYWST